MKKIMVAFFIIAAFVACNSNTESKEAKTEEVKTETNDITKNPDYQNGLELASKSDCFTCHKIDELLTGPPFREVANKYANEPDTIVAHLAHKVIEGGSGVWGQIPMTPHPTISQADAEAMVKYVLLLKK
ncbi:MAG: c-type cytochrome [Bacteroidia bacterium]|nr:c-type cytochrome [Bacteroidia bacterium]